jgi:glutamyl-tRNA reductase
MDQIGVAGASYRHVGTDEIAAFTIPKAEIPARLAALREALGTSEIVYLATCNRVEVVYAMPEGGEARDCRSELFEALTGRAPQPGEARASLRAWTGEAAIEHVFLVACGLDSAQAGEREIAAQLREAWEAARTANVSGRTLDRVLGEALSMASRMQGLAAGAKPVSLAELAADRMRRHYAEQPGTIAMIGVSPMTRRCGALLHEAGVPLLVVNRTLDTALEWAQTVGAEAISLEEFRARPRSVSGIVVATGGSEPVLDAMALARLTHLPSKPPLIVDFGLPPNVDPDAASHAGITRIGMDEMIHAAQERRMSQLLRLAPVRAAIDERLARLRAQLATRAIGKQLAELRGSFEQIATAEAERALSGELARLGGEDQEHVRRFATMLARRLAHLPLAGMRAAAEHGTAEMVDAFFREARLQRSVRNGADGEAPAAISAASTDGQPRAGHTSAPIQKGSR